MPAVKPLKIPVVELIVATDVFDDDHDPPETASVRVILDPTQTEDGPAIAEGKLVTVTGYVVAHPVLNV